MAILFGKHFLLRLSCPTWSKCIQNFNLSLFKASLYFLSTGEWFLAVIINKRSNYTVNLMRASDYGEINIEQSIANGTWPLAITCHHLLPITMTSL